MNEGKLICQLPKILKVLLAFCVPPVFFVLVVACVIFVKRKPHLVSLLASTSYCPQNKIENIWFTTHCLFYIHSSIN